MTSSSIPSPYNLSLYQNLSVEEDIERTNVHYTLPARFFEVLTGGKWHLYSCNIWDLTKENDIESQDQQTESQERKMDLFAEQMQLKAGMHVLDVGAGWGGPLIYLCKKYKIIGTGIMLSQVQCDYANQWAKRENVECNFSVCHWSVFQTQNLFNAVYTDEVIVHFFRLEDYFKKVFSLLRDDGVMLNKEIHYTHPIIGKDLTPTGLDVSAIYGGTGNYRALAEELLYTNNAGFFVDNIIQLSPKSYVLSITSWEKNIFRHREELETLVGKEKYDEFRRYLRFLRMWFVDYNHRMRVHISVSRKLPHEIHHAGSQ